jgi:hypothetical protein
MSTLVDDEQSRVHRVTRTGVVRGERASGREGSAGQEVPAAVTRGECVMPRSVTGILIAVVLVLLIIFLVQRV